VLRRANSAAVPTSAPLPGPGAGNGSPGSPLNLRGGVPVIGSDLLRTLSPQSSEAMMTPARTVSLGAVGSLA
jgi:hypothetical protein